MRVIQWDDLFKAETGAELFILLNKVLRRLSGGPGIKINGTEDGGKFGLQMQVEQTITVRHEGRNKISRPVTQVFTLLQDGSLRWDLKLTGETITGLVNVQARLRQVMEDSWEHLKLTSGDPSGAQREEEPVVWNDEWILVGDYVPESTEPTLTFTVPHEQATAQSSKKDNQIVEEKELRKEDVG
ncbi:MAG: hypothetical protein JXB30_09645 [Anaerolineae bacterium]|nr:hypothetical protein [Anaerolineae bacterium]